MSHHESGPAFEYSQITDHIFIGTNACCAMHFDQELVSKDVVADISLDDVMVDKPFGVEGFLWLPTVDHQPPSHLAMKLGLSMLAELEAVGKKCYVHCKNGHGRAPTLVAAYLIVERGMAADVAMGLVQEKRPSVHFEVAQVDFLRGLKTA